MKIRNIGVLIWILFLLSGCSSAVQMHFVKPGGSEQQFRQACEVCKREVTVKHPESHGPYPGSDTASLMTGTSIEVIRAMSGFTWKDVENFQECMELRGWFFPKSGESSSFSVKLDGSWRNIVLEYPSSR